MGQDDRPNVGGGGRDPDVVRRYRSPRAAQGDRNLGIDAGHISVYDELIDDGVRQELPELSDISFDATRPLVPGTRPGR